VRRFPTGRLFATFVLGALLEPLGHAAAYALRYGPSQAWQLQSQGSHAYFPRVFSLSAISLTVAAALGLTAVISIRLILGSRRISATGIRRTFAILAATQCVFFVSKETIEALAVQAAPDFVSIAILAICVQLPLAALAAWMIAWTRGYLELGPDAIRAILAVRLAPPVGPVVLRPLPVPALRADLRGQRWYRRRGPPSSS
jgi:uncharacterized membrane protein